MPMIRSIRRRNEALPEVRNENARHEHGVQFYQTPQFLAESVADFTAKGLLRGEGAVVIATSENRAAITEALRTRGASIEEMKGRGQLRLIDAESALSTFMVDGHPDATRFEFEIGGLIRQVETNYPRVRAYGEMVAILWRAGNVDATIALEDLWNGLATRYSFSLLCGYSLHEFGEHHHGEGFKAICSRHSNVFPSEEYLKAPSSEEQLKRVAILEQQSHALRIELMRSRRLETELRESVQNHQSTAELLKKSESFASEIIDSSRDSIQVLDVDARLEFANSSALSAIGVDHLDEVVGMCWFDFWDGENRMKAEAAFEVARSGSGTGELVAFTSSGRYDEPRCWHVLLSLIHDFKGGVDKVLAVSRDVTDARRLERDLLQALRARDELMSICSHELKTPLSSLKLQTDIAKRRISKGEVALYSPDKVRRMVFDYEKQVNRLVHLVDDMLDLTRINSGKLKLNTEKVNLSPLIYEVLEKLSDRLSAAGCEVTAKVSPGIVGRWDRYRLEQVLLHLLTNAVKYGGKRPIEILAAKSRDGRAYVAIRDYGSGIAPEDHERVFHRFERAISANEVSGLGLGLYIVKQIVDAHAGKIRLESEKGAGSTFTFDLPLEVEESP